MYFPVTPQKNDQLQKDFERLGIKESDLDESFVRSSGPGGQSVNKTSSCVTLRHLPTGILIKCQEERSQALNRYRARRILVERLDQMIHGRESAEAQRIAKIRRQKRKRSKRAKDKMLASKKAHSEKKQNRRPVRGGDE